MMKIITVLLVVIAVIGFIGVSNSAFGSTVSKKTGGTFVLGTVEDEIISTLNPLTASGLAGDIDGIIYADSLLFEFDNGSYIPWLAHSWTITNDGKTITFNLVHNAYWMNGSSKAYPLTSQDVKFTFEVLASNSSLDVNDVSPYISNISTPNNYTIIFNLTEPNVMMFYFIGSQVIIPLEWENYVTNISQIGSYTDMNVPNILTCGPMVLSSISQSNYVDLSANPYFFKGKPNFSSEKIIEYESSSSMIEALEAGEINATYVDPNSAYQELKTYPDITAVAFKDTFDLNLWFDVNVAPYNNSYFRTGLSYAINKTEILNKAEDGLGGKVSFGGLPWTLSSYYNKSIPYRPFNYTIANKYFKEAGLHIGSSGYWEYSNGTIVKINLIDLNLADWDAASTLIQNDLSNDHFETSFVVVPTAVWVSDLFSGGAFYVASFFNFGPLFANPWFDLWAEYDYQGYWNFEHFNDPTLNNLFNQSETMVLNPQAFNNTIDEIQGIINSTTPTIPVMGSEVYYAYNNQQVGGFYPNQQLISPLDSLYAYQVQPVSHSSTTNYYGYIIGAVIILIVIGIVLGIYYSRKKSK